MMAGTIHFAKFESTGNDFIMVDNRSGDLHLTGDQISKWCHRRFGTGADGLILLENDPTLAFRMRYFNADGHEASFCGNGGRAICGFAAMLGMRGSSFVFGAFDGQHTGHILSSKDQEWQVSLSMRDVMIGTGQLINTGSPHLVIEADNPEAIDIRREGALHRYAEAFAPDGCNVNFIRTTHEAIHIRTYERGVEDETLSCGTGVTAAAIHHYLQHPDGEHAATVHARGGILTVSLVKHGNQFTKILLTGPTRCVFQGEYYL
jgi:diaminopimelate epimerase